MSSKGTKTLIAALLAAFSGAVIGLFVLIGLILFSPTNASNINSSVVGETQNVNQASTPNPIQNVVEQTNSQPNESPSSTPTPTIEITPTPIKAENSPSPRTTFTPIAIPAPETKQTKTPVINRTPNGGAKTPKIPAKTPVPTPSVHT